MIVGVAKMAVSDFVEMLSVDSIIQSQGSGLTYMQEHDHAYLF